MSLKGKKGVDISSFQQDVDMRLIKAAGYEFVMIKCGNGSDISSQDDPYFEANVKKAESLGLPWGVYLYSYACSIAEAKSEVEHVKRLLKGKKPTLPVAFDMEDADNYKKNNGALYRSLVSDICATFLNGIKAAGYYPMLYTSLSWLGYYITSDVYSKFDLWVAQWSSTCQYTLPNLGLWQYGGEINYLESNSISGVGTVDKNKCYKDYPAIIKSGGYNNWAKGSAPAPDETYAVSDTDTATVQRWLNKVYSYGLAVDNIYGPKTRAAIIKGLQNVLNVKFKAKLEVDGIFGAKTKAAVRPLSKGSHGGYPSILQAFLICLGYDTGGFDGDYGSRTESAVKTFQTVKGLKVTGTADANTFEALAKAG